MKWMNLGFGILLAVAFWYGFENFKTEPIFFRVAFMAACVSIIFRANREAIIPQESDEAGFMKAYDKRIYKKSQRIVGRIWVSLGMIGLLAFICTPNKYLSAVAIGFMSLAFITAIIAIYKSVKAIDA